MSASKGDKGEWRIDPAELFRVYPKKNSQILQSEQNETPENTLKHKLLEQEVEHLREHLERERKTTDDLKQDRDKWREQAEKSTILLTHQQAQTTRQPPPQGRVRRAWDALTGKL